MLKKLCSMLKALKPQDTADQSRGSKVTLFLAIIVAHLAMLLWVAKDHKYARHFSNNIVLFNVAMPRPNRSPHHFSPPNPTPVIKQVVLPLEPIPLLPSVALPENSASNAASGTECNLTSAVQLALRGSQPIREALSDLPSSAKSVANALMVWDGKWIAPPTPSGGRTFALIQKAIIEVVGASSEQCKSEQQMGPRLLILPGSPDTVIAVGSGAWHWADMNQGIAPDDP